MDWTTWSCSATLCRLVFANPGYKFKPGRQNEINSFFKKGKEITGNGRDMGMHTALYVSRVIHHDLVYGNASAWCWWLGISTADFKDGLVYVNRDVTGLTDSKTMWAMGNFSQFIKPGAVRVKY